MRGRHALTPYLLLAFPVVILSAFVVVPTLAGLGLAFVRWDGSGLPRWVGLENFAGLARDGRFRAALVNTLVFVLATVPVTTLSGFVLASAVHARWFRGRAAVRTMLFMPSIVSIVAIGFAWRWVLDDRGGVLPAGLRVIGISPPDFLRGGAIVSVLGVDVLAWPMLSIMCVQVWRGAGFCAVLYLAAMTSINEALYEAAEVDGASRWRVMRHVTWPQVAPMTAFLLVTGVIGALQVFDIVWAMTAGAETDATSVLNLYAFREFERSRLGYAASLGVVVLGLTLAATAGQLAVMRRWGRA